MSAMASQITGVTIVYSIVCSGAADQRKHQTSVSLVSVRGIHRWTVNSLHKGLVTRKMFPFDDVIMWSVGDIVEYLTWRCDSVGKVIDEWPKCMDHNVWIACSIIHLFDISTRSVSSDGTVFLLYVLTELHDDIVGNMTFPLVCLLAETPSHWNIQVTSRHKIQAYRTSSLPHDIYPALNHPLVICEVEGSITWSNILYPIPVIVL